MVGAYSWIAGCLCFLFSVCCGQKGIASLNDPCDCMQHHDWWMSSRAALINILWTTDYPEHLFQEEDPVHKWTGSQSCMYSPENEESHRPTALSDCIPGFLLVHIVCIQRQIVDRRPDRAMDYAAELIRLYPFGATCLANSVQSGWPLLPEDVIGYYRRVRRAFASGPSVNDSWPVELLREMAWHPREYDVDEPERIEAADVCPAGTLADLGLCWVLGSIGATCKTACGERNLVFRRPKPYVWPDWPLVPRLLDLAGKSLVGLQMEASWKAFECYVPNEDRFVLADPVQEYAEDWSYPICALACPCVPILAPSIEDILQFVPDLEDA